MKLDNNWITGFVDGEGCFYVGINKNSTMSLKIQVLPEFVVTQHISNIKVLYGLKEFFGCGIIKRNHDQIMSYCVRSLKHLTNVIIPFFDKYQLKTVKKFNFLRFKWVVNSMVLKKYHLQSEGLKKIILVKNRMNKNLL